MGYIMAKESAGSYQIGPWMSHPKHSEKDEVLLLAVMEKAQGRKLWVGVPEENRKEVETLRQNRFEDLPSSLRMCLGDCTSIEYVS